MDKKHLYSFDPRRKIYIGENEMAAVTFATDHFITIAKDALEEKGAFFVALSGGSTPKKIYQMLANHHRSSIDWSKVYIFWSDERSVPPDHPDSNYKMAMDHGMNSLGIPQNQIFRMHGEKNAIDGAKQYEATIDRVLKNHSFDLIMLGMGDDGHTASLFPKTKALHEKNARVCANYVDSKKTWRITFTFDWINEAKNIAIYVLGDRKKERLFDVLFDKSNSYPASKIGTIVHPAIWIVDKAAAKEILKHFDQQEGFKKAV